MNAPSDITLYIAGPMTGLPQLNYPAFHAAARQLRAAGYTVLNPAEGERPCRNPTWEDWMRQAIGMLIRADHIATLPGWHESRGAVIEVNLASNLGMGRESVDRHLEAATTMATP